MIPYTTIPLFWDVNPENLKLKEHKEFIIERILEKGRKENVRWLWRTYTASEIKDVLKSSENTSRGTAYLWSKIMGVPLNQIKCLKKPYQKNCFNF